MLVHVHTMALCRIAECVPEVAWTIGLACQADEALALSKACKAWLDALRQPRLWLRFLRGPIHGGALALARPMLSRPQVSDAFSGGAVHAENYRAVVAAFRAPGWTVRYAAMRRAVDRGLLREPRNAVSTGQSGRAAKKHMMRRLSVEKKALEQKAKRVRRAQSHPHRIGQKSQSTELDKAFQRLERPVALESFLTALRKDDQATTPPITPRACTSPLTPAKVAKTRDGGYGARELTPPRPVRPISSSISKGNGYGTNQSPHKLVRSQKTLASAESASESESSSSSSSTSSSSSSSS